MPAATPLPVRQALFRASLPGADLPTVARRFGLSLRTARRLLRQAGQAGQALPPAYRCGPPPGQPPPQLAQQARALRQQHPSWGAALIRVILGRHYPPDDLPCARTIRRWLAQAGLAPAPPGRPPSAYRRADRVHALWQGDAADQMPRASDALVSWLRLVDEGSGAVLRTTVFPPGVQPGQRRLGAGQPAPGLRPVGPARRLQTG